MTSVVDTSVKYVRWDQPGIASLMAATGSGIALLDMLLVNGGTPKAATSLVVTGGVAQLNVVAPHMFIRDNVIVVSGAVNAALNGEQKVTAITSTYVQFATAQADGTDTGTVTFKLAALGWSKTFSNTGTNKATYKSVDVTGNGMTLRVDDSNAVMMFMKGFETMADVDTGTGQFPLDTQVSGGLYWFKGRSASATAKPWIFVGDSKMFYLHIAVGWDSTAGFNTAYGAPLRGFGDPIAFRPAGDAYFTVLAGVSDTGRNSDSSGQGYWGSLDYYSTSNSSYAARGYAGLGSSIMMYSQPYIGVTAAISGMDSYCGNFPSPITGALILSKRFLQQDSVSSPRGELPGLYTVPQQFALDGYSYGSTVEGTGILAGRRLVAYCTSNQYLYQNANRTVTGIGFLDITGPWR